MIVETHKASIPSPTITPTVTNTDTPTPVPTHTPTDVPAAFTLISQGICRAGPTDVYEVVSYVIEGQTGTILGRNEDSTWWWVSLDEGEENCWLPDLLVTTQGALDNLVYIEAPPSPPTVTPHPPWIVYYLIHKDTGGPLKCGDSLFPISTGKFRTGDIEEDAKIAFKALLALKQAEQGDFYNALYKSSLNVVSADWAPQKGWLEVSIAGNMNTKGDECDRSRIGDQLWATIRQFPEVQHADIRWNGGPLMDRIYSP